MEWNDFILGDSLEIMEEIETRSVDLIFTSVPDLNDLNMKDISQYEIFITKVVDYFGRIAKDTGFVVMCQTDRKIEGKVYPKHAFIIRVMECLGFVLKDYKIMVVNNIESKDQYRFPYQHLSVFTRKGTIQRKGEWMKHILVYDMKKYFSYYSWNENFVKLVVENLSKENDKVFDPFAGSGVVPYVARNLNRQYLACEIDEEIYNNSLMKTARW